MHLFISQLFYFSGCLPQENENLQTKGLYNHVFNCFIHNRPNLKMVRIFIKPWMDTQIVVYLFNRILLSNKKERTAETFNKANESHDSSAAKHKRIHSVLFYLYEVLEIGKTKLWYEKSEQWLPGGRGQDSQERNMSSFSRVIKMSCILMGWFGELQYLCQNSSNRKLKMCGFTFYKPYLKKQQKSTLFG